jgi:hypothetical protein
VFGAWPESAAMAAIIAWLPAQQSVPQRDDGILDFEFRLPCAEPVGESFESVTPLWIRVVCLVSQGKECRFDVDALRGVGLPYVQL